MPKDWTQERALAGIISEVEESLKEKSFTRILARVVDWDSLGRNNAFGVVGILV